MQHKSTRFCLQLDKMSRICTKDFLELNWRNAHVHVNVYNAQWIMAILSKRFKPGNFELHNSLKLSFVNIWGLCSNFVDCESFRESNSLEILALCETNVDDSVDSGNFSVRGYFLFNLKGFYYSYMWPCSLCEGRTSFCMGLISRKLCRSLLMFLTGFTSLSVFLLFPPSMTFIQPCAQVFILFHVT